MSPPILSIIICTFNRSEVLGLCLNKVLEQITTNSLIEVLVVDNNSTDDTKNLVTGLMESNACLSYIKETTQGVGYARNRGGEEAKGYYLGYLDDDAMIGSAFFYNAIDTIKNCDFDIFGGKVLPWFRYGRPRWFPSDFEINFPNVTKLGTTKQWIEIWGGVLFVKRHLFEKVEGFPTHIGPVGTKFGYGEDSAFVKKMYDSNYQLGFNPKLIIYHLVRKEKLNLKWFVFSAYKKGRASIDVIGKERIPLLVLKIFYFFFKNFFTSAISFLTQREYYWEHCFLDIIQPLAALVGKLIGCIKEK